MKCSIAAAFACLGVLPTTGASVASGAALLLKQPMDMSPVTRIVELLKGLKGQCEADLKADETLYEKFVCWGNEIIRQKEASNAIAERRLRSSPSTSQTSTQAESN